MDELEVIRQQLTEVKDQPKVIVKFKLCDLSPTNALRWSEAHFENVLAWMKSFSTVDHIMLDVVKDNSGNLRVYDGRARLSAAKECFDGDTEIDVLVYPGTLKEACASKGFGDATCSLNVQEKVAMVGRLYSLLSIPTYNHVQISSILNEVCHTEAYTIRVCRIAAIGRESDRDKIAGTFGDEKLVCTELYTPLIRAYGMDRVACLDAIDKFPDRAGLIKALSDISQTDKLLKGLMRGYSQEEALAIAHELIDIYAPEHYVNSGSFSTRVKKGKTQRSAAQLIDNIREAFSNDCKAVSSNISTEAFSVSADILLLPYDNVHGERSGETIRDRAMLSTGRQFFLMVREKSDTLPTDVVQSLDFILMTNEREFGHDGLMTNSLLVSLAVAENGILADDQSLKEMAKSIGLCDVMIPSSLFAALRGSIGVWTMDTIATNVFVAEALPYVQQFVIPTGKGDALIDLIKANYGRLPPGLRVRHGMKRKVDEDD